MRLILASTSSRRRDILALLGLPFEVIAPEYKELPLPGRPLDKEVLEFAVGKAESVARDNPQSIVIGSDTMILLDGRKIGKPDGLDDAKEILRSLSGKTHRIFTSVAILDGLSRPSVNAVEEVSVRMRAYSDEEIERYLSANESLDKAGAYSIQGKGRALIESIRGDYLAAVGLPLKPIDGYLTSRGIMLSVDVEKLYSDKAFANWRSF
ncbi:MAG: Maf family protein [Candidatus Binatia bacterium]